MKKSLTVIDAVSIIVGIVVGVGIFKTPSLVAIHTGSQGLFVALWLAGGLFSLAGALCYAELATAYPHPGGDYHYITLAFGKETAFFFAWARMTVIQTGSIAMLAFILGDYLSQVASLGAHSSSLYAALSIAALTMVNIIGIKEGKALQNLLTIVKVAGLALIIAGGIFAPGNEPVLGQAETQQTPMMGLAMVFVLLTYGGWNEAAYISAELKEVRKNMVRSLVWGIGLITAIYLLINAVYLKVLGLDGIGRSEAVAYDMIMKITGPRGAVLVSLLVGISAMSALNGTIITGARTNYALGKEFALFGFLGYWKGDTGTPARALILQGLISMLLVFFGTVTMKGFVTMVEFTAPVFWFFFFLTTLSLIVLRFRHRAIVKPFRVPFYPLTPLVFCGVCLFMLVASIRYTGMAAMAGVGVLCAGLPFLLFSTRSVKKEG